MDETIADAINQLRRSHQGREALGVLNTWLNRGSGCNLDAANQEAVAVLLDAAWGGFAGSVTDALGFASPRATPRVGA